MPALAGIVASTRDTALLLAGHHGAADDLLARALGHVHPFFAAVGSGLARAGVLARAAVVLACLGDAGALLFVVLGGERAAGGGDQADGEQAGDRGADDEIGLLHGALLLAGWTD